MNRRERSSVDNLLVWLLHGLGEVNMPYDKRLDSVYYRLFPRHTVSSLVIVEDNSCGDLKRGIIILIIAIILTLVFNSAYSKVNETLRPLFNSLVSATGYYRTLLHISSQTATFIVFRRPCVTHDRNYIFYCLLFSLGSYVLYLL
jgi:hypothetical protein